MFRPSIGTWYIRYSGGGAPATMQWGTTGDVTVHGDYDGDGRTDLAVYRPSTASWYVLTSSTNFTASFVSQWGTSTDVAVPADYDGDGKTDVAVFRPSNGTWHFYGSSTGTSTSIVWGTAGDIALPQTYLQRWVP